MGKFAFENNIKIICAKHEKDFLKYQDEIIDTIYSSNSKDDRIQTEIVNHTFK
jgi:hypothetical protein